MDDRNRVSRLVGRKVALVLDNGAEIVATLEEARRDGVVLSEISELGPGPTMFCAWDSLRRLRDGPPYFMSSDEGHESNDYYELYEHREVPPEEIDPEPSVERRRASARNLDRVVPIGHRCSAGDVTVALTSLELFGEGIGVLRYRISYGAGMFEGDIPQPELIIRDGPGRELPWSPQDSGSGDREADGEIEVRELPEAGELEVEVRRLVSLAYDGEADEEVVQDSCDGPWIFSFSI